MKHRARHFLPFQLFLAAVTVAFGAACSSDSTNSAPLIATSIVANAGSSGQSGAIGTALAQPISVGVTDQNANPLAGVVVTWTVVANAGTVDSATSTTNSAGNAVTHWTLGSTVGTQTLNATLANGASVSIVATATAAVAAHITKVSGDAQSVASGGSTSQPMVVKVTDQFGNAVVGATVTWASASGTLSAATTTTDVNGMAQVTLATAATAQTYSITATTGTLAAVTFTVTGT